MGSDMTVDIGIGEAERKTIAEGLSKLLADTYLLYHKTHGYHWNVEGPMFNTLHTMFMTQYTELWAAIDEIAERIRALGHYAPTGTGAYGQLSSIGEDNGVPKAEAMIANLVKGHEAVARTARELVGVAEANNDAPTADLATQRMQASEKTAWMLRSMLA